MESSPPPPPPPLSISSCFLKYPLVCFAPFLLFLLLLLLKCFSSCSCLFSSTPVTIFALALSTSPLLIFSKTKRLGKCSTSTTSPPAGKDEIIKKISADQIDDGKEFSDGEELHEINADDDDDDEGDACNDNDDIDLISDDDSLIEIALVTDDEHLQYTSGTIPVVEGQGGGVVQQNGLQCGFSTELLFRKHGLMELLSEINEEDNLIEIDITMGSIKCSRLGIKA